mmetsp:Transcript_3171/g.6402  ORF Transcript_3171/g.6402 Transcript_3171/m.6402 type:complete len:103 (-) Transcript_3171:80-388(-)
MRIWVLRYRTRHSRGEGGESRGERQRTRVITKESTEGFDSSVANRRSGTNTGNNHTLPRHLDGRSRREKRSFTREKEGEAEILRLLDGRIYLNVMIGCKIAV